MENKDGSEGRSIHVNNFNFSRYIFTNKFGSQLFTKEITRSIIYQIRNVRYTRQIGELR